MVKGCAFIEFASLFGWLGHAPVLGRHVVSPFHFQSAIGVGIIDVSDIDAF